MATYPVINKKTGEQKDIVLSVHEWTKWCEDNPDWQRDWSDPSTCPAAGEVGEWKDKLRKSHPVNEVVEHKNGSQPSKTNPRLKLMPRRESLKIPLVLV